MLGRVRGGERCMEEKGAWRGRVRGGDGCVEGTGEARLTLSPPWFMCRGRSWEEGMMN